MLGTCRLNNKSMRGIRREAAYQCMAIDLAMLGVISKEECEMLLGSGIPKNVLLPDGSAGKLISEKNIPEQPVKVEQTEETEPVVTEETEQVEQTEETEGSDSDEGDETQE